MTNGEKIRQMDDTELTLFLMMEFPTISLICGRELKKVNEWLKKEVD